MTGSYFRGPKTCLQLGQRRCLTALGMSASIYILAIPGCVGRSMLVGWGTFCSGRYVAPRPRCGCVASTAYVDQRAESKAAFEILGVKTEIDPTDDEVRKAYRRAAAKYHPDSPTADARLYQQVQDAYEFITGGKITVLEGKRRKEERRKAKQVRKAARKAKAEEEASGGAFSSVLPLIIVIVAAVAINTAVNSATKDASLAGPPLAFVERPAGTRAP